MTSIHNFSRTQSAHAAPGNTKPETTMETDTGNREAGAVGVPRLVRLLEDVGGMYCKFAAGEVVKHTLHRHGMAKLERVPWRNSLTISNILITDERWLAYEVEPNSEIADAKRSAHRTVSDTCQND